MLALGLSFEAFILLSYIFLNLIFEDFYYVHLLDFAKGSSVFICWDDQMAFVPRS